MKKFNHEFIQIGRTTNDEKFVVPPLGGIVWRHGVNPRQKLPPKGGTTNSAASAESVVAFIHG
jgi:hypothetical protein